MAKVTLSADMQPYTGAAGEVDVAARNYRELVTELRRRFPSLPEETITRQALAIDGVLIHTPLLETFRPDSELIFVARVAGG